MKLPKSALGMGITVMKIVILVGVGGGGGGVKLSVLWSQIAFYCYTDIAIKQNTNNQLSQMTILYPNDNSKCSYPLSI